MYYDITQTHVFNKCGGWLSKQNYKPEKRSLQECFRLTIYFYYTKIVIIRSAQINILVFKFHRTF